MCIVYSSARKLRCHLFKLTRRLLDQVSKNEAKIIGNAMGRGGSSDGDTEYVVGSARGQIPKGTTTSKRKEKCRT